MLLFADVYTWRMCCSVLQCVAVCCSVLLFADDYTWHISLHLPSVFIDGTCVSRSYMCCSVLQCVAVCCSVLQCVAVCSSDMCF